MGANERREHQAIRLSAGRLLGFAEYGDPAGEAVLVFHREVGSRLLGRAFDGAARELGVRIVSPDRPGMGFSDAQPGRVVADWPVDVAGLTDALGIDRFAALGVSGGAAYALACALRLADRVTGAVLVGPSLPAPLSELPPDAPPVQRLLHRSAVRAPSTIRPVMTLLGQLSRRAPEQVLRRMEESAADADRGALGRPEVRALLRASMAETFRRGAGGVAHDLGLVKGDWGLPLGRIGVEVHLWHGDADTDVPLSDARKLAAALPRGQVLQVPGAGHHLDLARPELPLAGVLGR